MIDNCGVYQITNVANGNFYIGSSFNIRKRLADHRQRLDNNKHGNQHLQRAWAKYGEDSFTFETILLCDKSMTLYCEQELLEQLKPAYNMCPTAGSSSGRITSAATRALISAARKGKNKGNTNGIGSMGMLGKHHTPETIAKLRAAATGRVASAESIAINSAAQKLRQAARRIATGGIL